MGLHLVYSMPVIGNTEKIEQSFRQGKYLGEYRHTCSTPILPKSIVADAKYQLSATYIHSIRTQ